MSDVFDGSPQDLLNRLRDRDRVALGRAITLVESTRPADRPAARELIAAALKVGTLAVRIGITGIPGVGKSTLIDVLGSHLVTQGHHVAVLAIDPSSTRGLDGTSSRRWASRTRTWVA